MLKSLAAYSILLLLLLVTFTQCSTSRERQLKREYKMIYIDQFKLTYFQKLLQAGFNNSEKVSSLIKSDKSRFTEPGLSRDDYQLIESMAQSDNSDNMEMRTDSVGRIGRVAEGAEGKHVFSHILYKLEGKSLDSLAEQRYKLSNFRNTSRY